MPSLSSNLSWQLANKIWAAAINPILLNPLNGTKILKNIVLNDGVTIINHGLGKTMQGWFLVDLQGPVIPYRSAPFNSTTLTLTSSAIVTVSIGVF